MNSPSRLMGIASLVLLLILVTTGSADTGHAGLVLRESAASTPIHVRARYSGRVLFVKVGDIVLDAELSSDGYSALSSIEAAGLAEFFTDFELHAEARGEFAPTGRALPEYYGHVERTGDKVRAVDVSFEDEVATSQVEPPFGSWGVPPASETDRTGVLDPVAAFLQLSANLVNNDRSGCAGSLPVFDGKARYNLNLEDAGRRSVRMRAWRGEVLVCHAWYEPISGYDPEDYPDEDELRHPLTIWLAPLGQGEHFLPVRLHTGAGFGVTITATDLLIE